MTTEYRALIQAPAPEPGTVDRVKNGTQLIKIAAVWLLIFLLGVAASIVTIAVVNTKDFGPEKTVARYLDALKAGDGGTARGLLNAKIPGANAAALDGKALAQSQKDVKELSIAPSVPTDENTERVTVSYTVTDVPLSTDFVLQKGPKHWLFFDSWEMVPVTLPVINASVVNAHQSSINGVEANMPDGKNSFAVFYPGNYELEYRSPLFAAPPVTRTVTGSTEAVSPVSLATGPTSDLLAQVDGTIRKYLDACAKQAVLMPTGCPLNAATNNRVLSSVAWSIVEYPAITITPFGGQWIMAPLKFKAQVAFKEQDLFTGQVSPVKQTSDFSFTTKLTITANNVLVTPVLDF